jgi:hypothetical protein
MDMKVCCRCKRDLPAIKDYFYGDKNRPDGLHPSCRECEGHSFAKPKPKVKPGYKICIKCGNELPMDNLHFHYDKLRKDGYNPYCRSCLGRKYRQNDPDYIKPLEKECNKCHRILPATADYFHSSKGKHSNRDGLTPTCKECAGYEFGMYSYQQRLKKPKKVMEKPKIKDGYKICTKCKRELEANTDNFIKAKYGKYGLTSICKDCAKLYYEENRDVILEKTIKRQRKNAEKKSEYDREYRQKNIDKKRAYEKLYAKNNIEKFIEVARKRRHKERRLLVTFTPEQWEECLLHFNNECAYCGKTNCKLEKEHFIPIGNDGSYTRDNIIPACKSCNCSKGPKPFEVWYPRQPFYSPEREKKILDYLGYKDGIQQLSIL